MPQVSVVVPMRNEAPNVRSLIEDIATSMSDHDFEIIVVDDGSTDATAERLRECRESIGSLRLLQNTTSAGQSAAVHSGVQAARSDLICTIDGDGQNPAEDLPRLLAPLLCDSGGEVGLVAGQRKARKDTFSKRAASRMANALRARVLHDGTRDSGCGLKAFRRDAFLGLPYFDHMHRYLPALFARDGWQVRHVDVGHRERAAGRSNYNNFDRALQGAVDLVGVAWLVRRRKKATPTEISGMRGKDD